MPIASCIDSCGDDAALTSGCQGSWLETVSLSRFQAPSIITQEIEREYKLESVDRLFDRLGFDSLG